jgi:primosomal protein N'
MALCDLEILDRRSSKLPPFTRLATITGESSAIRLLATQVKQDELFSSVSVISKLPASNEQSKLVLRADIEKSEKFSLFLRDLARYRSLKGLIPLSIRIDPYSI